MTRLCDYGCEKIAKHQFKNGKWCCENYFAKCPEERRKKSIRCIGRNQSEESKEKSRQSNIGQKRSKETCKNISKSLKGLTPWNKNIPCSDETKKKISISNTGKKHTEETKQKQSEMRKGVKKNPEHKRNIGIAHTGKKRAPFSKEWKENLSKGNKNKVVSIETRRKISKSKTGVPRSKETKRKLRLSTIKRIENQVGQISPNYNPDACIIIDKYGIENNYSFQHAMNGGEFRIQELGYWVDGYDKNKNTIIEIDEPSHYSLDQLSERDINRQKEITEYLNCRFIRIRVDKENNIINIVQDN